ncbi:TlpA disulfide reductase family protein [Albibacterium sp.]|uniref:TlpA disulfide reductase family protein n=1 Tax=Albibacterium sp. TaxID=2952885 RepID=UPI002C375E74|nr:TlpA disulfide reductase family protein [Albibacterium sp.]HUH17651.1 TlpA disulfide reductase family protein [Albibacterium sp.]
MIKRMLLSAFVVLPFMVFAQENYTITGEITNAPNTAKAYLIYSDGAQRKIDSTSINQGKFTFAGVVSQPGEALLTVDHKGVGMSQLSSPDLLNLFLEGGEISIKGTDSIYNAVLSGTPLNNDRYKLNSSLAAVTAKEKAFRKRFSEATQEEMNSPEFNGRLESQYNALQKEKDDAYINFIKTSPNSLLSLRTLLEIAGPMPDVILIEPLLNSLSPELQEMAPAKELRQLLELGKRVMVGAIAPDFTQNDPDGNPVSLSSLQGKYVLIDFWASWCAPCRQENPNIVAAYEKYKDKGFTVLGVSLDRETGRDSWLKAIKDDELTWTQVSDLKFWNNAVAKEYGIRAIPRNFLLDPTGKIIAANIRGEELHTTLEEFLN